MSIENALKEFIESKKPGALVLQGTWGRGKTYLWNKLWQNYRAEAEAGAAGTDGVRYAYVSLFGVGSIDELKIAIFQNTVTLTKERKPSRKWFEKAVKNDAITNVVQELELPWAGKGVAAMYSAYASYSVNKMLICLDDIERRGASLRLVDVLGLISALTEQKDCRVAVILNSESLQDGDPRIWELHREKVFVAEMTYRPSSERCVDLVYSADSEDPLLQAVRRGLIELGVTNVRIAVRSRRIADQISKLTRFEELAREVKEDVGRSLALAAYCHSGSGEGAPSLAYARKYGAYRGPNDVRSEQEVAWDGLLSGYGYYLGSQVGKVVSEIVIEGFVEEASLAACLEQENANVGAIQLKRAYEEAWRKWHHEFNDDREELIAAFANAFPPAASLIDSHNADGTVRLMRELGENDLANRFASIWVASRAGARAAELAPDQIHRFDRVRDPVLLEGIEAAYDRGAHLPAFVDAMQRLVARDGLSYDTAQSIARVPAQEFLDYLRGNPGENTALMVRKCLEMGDHPNFPAYAEAREKAKEVIRMLANTSTFNDLRMRLRYPAVFATAA
jgi:hypothetical protein